MKTELFTFSTTELEKNDNHNNNTRNGGIVVGAYIVGSAGIVFFIVSATFITTCIIGRQCKFCIINRCLIISSIS